MFHGVGLMPPEKKKGSGDRSKDRHRSGFMLRLPEEFRAVLEALQNKNERPMSVEAQRAIIAYARAEGVPAPEAAIVRPPKRRGKK